MAISISELHCYPVKSCRGIALRTADIARMGIRYDRQWMVVDESGEFVAQRAERGKGVAVASMCFIDTAIVDDTLLLRAPGMPELSLPLAGWAGAMVPVSVWSHHCQAVDQGDDAAAWMSEYLARERPGRYRLVRMPDDGLRKPTHGDAALAFADAYPFLIVAQASLDDLNRRMSAPLPMIRFRPNIVLAGCAAYAEDHIARLRIGDIEFLGTNRCVRCGVTGIDPETGARGKEPLATLATYRRKPAGVIFGRNFNHAGIGQIAVGDVVAWE